MEECRQFLKRRIHKWRGIKVNDLGEQTNASDGDL